MEVCLAPDEALIHNTRNPLGPALRFTHDQWTDLLATIAAGRLPDYAAELDNGHVIKLLAPGQDDNALFFWLDEIDAFTHDVLAGKYGPVTTPATEQAASRNVTGSTG